MEIFRIRSITEYHRFRGLPKPEHPLISLVDYALVQFPEDEKAVNIVMDFYSIALKRDIGAKLHYGQQMYDFDEGLMSLLHPDRFYDSRKNLIHCITVPVIFYRYTRIFYGIHHWQKTLKVIHFLIILLMRRCSSLIKKKP